MRPYRGLRGGLRGHRRRLDHCHFGRSAFDANGAFAVERGEGFFVGHRGVRVRFDIHTGAGHELGMRRHQVTKGAQVLQKVEEERGKSPRKSAGRHALARRRCPRLKDRAPERSDRSDWDLGWRRELRAASERPK